MEEKNNIYVSPLGFILDEEELNLRRKQIDEVAKFLLSSDRNEEAIELDKEGGFTNE